MTGLEMQFGLPQSVIAQITVIFRKYDKLEKVILYGSRAMGNYKNGSDIDLTLVGPEISDRDFHCMIHDLEELNIPYSFDLCLMSAIDNSELIKHICDKGKIFYQRA